LVADGGSENHAVTIDGLLQTTEHPLITKIIALKDILFSNSSIEAINKIVKRYLRILNPQTLDKLTACIEFIVTNYSEKRPHGSLNGLTPFEAYTKPNSTLKLTTKMIEAKANRIAFNQNNVCKSC
jgi:putative transposase